MRCQNKVLDWNRQWHQTEKTEKRRRVRKWKSNVRITTASMNIEWAHTHTHTQPDEMKHEKSFRHAIQSCCGWKKKKQRQHKKNRVSEWSWTENGKDYQSFAKRVRSDPASAASESIIQSKQSSWLMTFQTIGYILSYSSLSLSLSLSLLLAVLLAHTQSAV